MNRKQGSSPADVRSRLAKRIQTRREQLRMTQAQLAKAAGLSAAQSVSDIEREKRDVKAVELAAIAKALHWNLTNLLLVDKEEDETLVVAWRQKPNDEAMIAQSRAYFLRLCENYALAELWAGDENEGGYVELPAVEEPKRSPDRSWARKNAVAIHKAMGLGSIPATELLQTLEERYGVKIFFMDDLPGSALCACGSFGGAIALNAKEVPWRRNYSLAHELFHLLTWEYLGPETVDEDDEDDGVWSAHIEKLADAFASTLLLPEDALLIGFERHRVGNGISWGGLIDLAREFVVSTEALLWRLVSLGLLDDGQIRPLLADPAFRGKDRETFPFWEKPNLYPDRFYRLVEQAYVQGEVSMGRVAEMTGFDLATTHNWLSQLESEEGNGVEQAEQLVRLA